MMVIVYEDKQFTNKRGKVVNGFYMDGILKTNIDQFLIKAVKKEFDGISCITGGEGNAKTTLACCLAYYCDPSFPMDCARVVFNSRQILYAIDNAGKGEAIVIDEAIISMGSQDAATDIQKILIKKFVTIRKKNLYIFIIIPSIFMLRKYFAIFRTRFLINCYTPDGVTRGFFGLYNKKAKRQLYIRGLKEMDMSVVRPSYKGRFTDTFGYFFDIDTYEKKKDDAIRNLSDNPEKIYMVELKKKFDDQIEKMNEYKRNIKMEFLDKVRAEKTGFKTKIEEIKKRNEERLAEITYTLNLSKSLKKTGDLNELIDFRDKILYLTYRDRNVIEVTELLRREKILDTVPQALMAYIQRGKSLIDLEDQLKT